MRSDPFALLLLAAYGLAFFVLGLAVAARLIGCAASAARGRLLALAGFGLLHAAFEWVLVVGLLTGDMAPAQLRMGLLAVSFLPLLHFAFGGLWAGAVSIAVIFASIGGWILAAAVVSDPVALEVVSRLGIGVPAAIGAAVALARDPAFGAVGKGAYTAHLAASAGFAAYGLLQIFSTPGAFFPADTLNTASFEAAFGFSCFAARAAAALVIAVAVLPLLEEFGNAARSELERRAADTHAALVASEARLRAILQSEPECVKVLDADCRVIDINPAGLQMIGADNAAEICGANILDRVDAGDRDAFREGVAAIFRGEPTRQLYKMIALDGTSRWMEQFAVPLYDTTAPDRVREMLAVTRDVTSRVGAERILTEIAYLLEQAQRIGNIGSWTTDYRTDELMWSDQIFRILGLVPQQCTPSYHFFMQRVHPDDRPLIVAAVRRAKEDNAPYDLEHRIVRPDGEVRVVHECGEIEFDAEGQIVRMIGTMQDITALRSAENARRRSEIMLSGILKISPEGIIVTDAEARITLFSAGAEAIFGYRAEEVIGRPIECLIPERFRAAHPAHVKSFAAAPMSSRRMGERAEIVGRRKNGEEFSAEASLSKLETPAGLVFTTIVRDITQHKAAHAELIAAKQRAETANEAKSLFIANVSHELRTPLNAIIGFSSLLMQGEAPRLTDAKRREYAGDIHRSGQHLLQVINDILDISRMEIGKLQLSESSVALPEFVESCVRMVRFRAAEAGIGLHVDVAADLPAIWVDARLLTQVVLNLLSNAIKFTARGGSICIAARDEGREGLTLTVRDTGIGMSEEDARRVAQPFVQIDNRLARKYDGTGLGLAIAKRLIEMHGGALSIESALGHGTTVSIHLPALRIVPAEAAAASA